jgi:hypothetical protein
VLEIDRHLTTNETGQSHPPPTVRGAVTGFGER